MGDAATKDLDPSTNDVRVFVVRTTDRCNMACRYCYVRGKGDASISLDTVDRLIAQSAELDQDTIVFVWHGGEPLLMGLRFFEAVVEIQNRHSKHFINALQTNGLCLHDGYVAFFKEHGFQVAVSLDLPRQRHHANRRLRDGETASFDLIASNLQRLARQNMPVAVLSVVSDSDLDLQAWIDAVEALRFDSLAVNVEFDFARKTDEAAANRLSRLLQGLYDHSAGLDRCFTLREADSAIEHLRHAPEGHCWHSPRFCGHTHSAVAANGDVYLCCDKFIDGPWAWARLGNVRAERLADIFSSDRFSELMRTLSTERSACASDCAIGRYCKGACVYDALMTRLNGDVDGARPRQVGCVARAALFRHIEQDFRSTMRGRPCSQIG